MDTPDGQGSGSESMADAVRRMRAQEAADGVGELQNPSQGPPPPMQYIFPVIAGWTVEKGPDGTAMLVARCDAPWAMIVFPGIPPDIADELGKRLSRASVHVPADASEIARLTKGAGE